MINFFRQLKFFGSLNSYKLIPKSDILFVNSDVNFSHVSPQFQYSILLNSIQEDLEKKGISCAQFIIPYTRLDKRKLLIPAYTADRLFMYLQFWFLVNSKIIKILNKFKYIENNDFDFEITFFDKVFNIAKPKVIFVIGATKSLCIAARKRNISIVEVIHGFGYDKIAWGWSAEESDMLPNYILTFDRVTTKTFFPLHEKLIKIKEIPHPWYKRFKEPFDDNSKIWLSKTDFIPKFKKIILLSLTWGYDGDHGPYTMYANILENGLIPEGLIKAIELSREDVFWCIKRHPVQMNEQVKYAKQIDFLNELTKRYSNCEWENTSSTNNVSLFLSCDGVVTMSSMIAYDASLFGIKTLMLCPTLRNGNPNQNRFVDLESLNFVKKADSDTNTILNWVSKVKKLNSFSISDSSDSDWEIFINDIL